MAFHIDYEKLLEKYKAIWTEIEDLKKDWITCSMILMNYEFMIVYPIKSKKSEECTIYHY